MVVDSQNRQAFARGLPNGFGGRVKDAEGFVGVDVAVGAPARPNAELCAKLAQSFEAALH
jgi:hypothetical protein